MQSAHFCAIWIAVPPTPRVTDLRHRHHRCVKTRCGKEEEEEKKFLL